MTRISIVIVNYNVRHYLYQCLCSVAAATRDVEAEVWVVDNHSSDGSVAYIRLLFPKVHFVESHHNLGFARANNLVLRQIETEYVLLLNPDTIIAEDTITKAIAFLDQHADAGAVGVKMLGANGVKALESRRGVPTPMTAFYKMVGLCKLFPKHPKLGRYYMSDLPWDAPAPVEIVSGACFFTRKAVLDKVGLLDEDYFMYAEDIDWAYRMLKAGFTNWYLPTPIIHYKGESTRKSSFRYVHVFYQAMLIFLHKHFRYLRIWVTLPIKVAIWCKAILTLIWVKLKSLRKTLGFFFSKQSLNVDYLLVSDQSSSELIERISRATGISLSYVERANDGMQLAPDSLLAGLGQKAGSTCVVYDTSVFTYGEILSMIELHDQSHAEVGFLHRDARCIITGKDVITWQ